MGKPLPPEVTPASGAPPSGDQANAVVSGTFAGLGVSAPFAFYGPFNVSIWASASGTIATVAASNTARLTFSAGAGISTGVAINSTAVPSGTTVGTLGNGATTTLATVSLNGLTTAQVAGLATATTAAIITGDGVGAVGTVRVERSFDGGTTWVTAKAADGTAAIFTMVSTTVSVVCVEPEKGVAYRLNCSAYTSGTFNYRISTTGAAATTWGPQGR